MTNLGNHPKDHATANTTNRSWTTKARQMSFPAYRVCLAMSTCKMLLASNFSPMEEA